jgi:Uri superfamily endonuclease
VHFDVGRVSRRTRNRRWLCDYTVTVAAVAYTPCAARAEMIAQASNFHSVETEVAGFLCSKEKSIVNFGRELDIEMARFLCSKEQSIVNFGRELDIEMARFLCLQEQSILNFGRELDIEMAGFLCLQEQLIVTS